MLSHQRAIIQAIEKLREDWQAVVIERLMHIKRVLNMPLARRLRNTAELNTLRSEGAELASQRIGACCSSHADLAALLDAPSSSCTAPPSACTSILPTLCHTGSGPGGKEMVQAEQGGLGAPAANHSDHACEGMAAGRLQPPGKAAAQQSGLLPTEAEDARQVVTRALLLRAVLAALSDTPLQDVPYGWQAAVWSCSLSVH
jgi:hypothetical protein